MNETGQRPRDRASCDRRYVEGELPWDSGVPDLHLSRVIEEHAVGVAKTLEVGCGTGTNAIWLAQQEFEVTGLDLSPAAIAKAEAKVAAAGVACRLVVGDLLRDEVPGAPFDLVYDRGCFHVFDGAEERSRFAARVGELLVPDGVWHSLVGSTDGPPRDVGPPRRSAVEIVAAVEPHFEVLELRSTTFDEDRHRHARAWVLVTRKRRGHPG